MSPAFVLLCVVAICAAALGSLFVCVGALIVALAVGIFAY